MIRNRGEGTYLLKEVQGVVPGSGNSAGRLTEKSMPRKLRLQERAAEVEEHIREGGGSMLVSLLERQIRRGLLGLLKVFRRNNITTKEFLKLYSERFTMRNGTVTLKNATDTPTLTLAPDPVPGSAAFMKLPMGEQIRIVDSRTATRKQTRLAESAKRVKDVSKVYGRA